MVIHVNQGMALDMAEKRQAVWGRDGGGTKQGKELVNSGS